MRKIFLFLIALSFFPVLVFAQSAAVEHASKEANFRLQTLAPWSKMTIEQKNLEKSPGWVVSFQKEDATGVSVNAPFALYIVDGRKSEDIRQTSVDFARGHAGFILFQLVEAQKIAPPANGLTLKNSEVKKYGEKSFIYMEYERDELKVYRIMTVLNNYTYSFNAQATNTDEGAAVKENLELMMSSLSKY